MTEPAVDLRDEPRRPSLQIPGFAYPDLHDALRLADLTGAFDRDLEQKDPDLFARFEAHRRAPLSGPAEGDLLVEVSGHVSRFVGQLFGVREEQAAQRAAAGRDAPLFRVKREFVQRRVFKKGAAGKPAPEEFPALDDEVEPLLAGRGRSGAGARAGDRDAARRAPLARAVPRALPGPRTRAHRPRRAARARPRPTRGEGRPL